MPQSRLSIKCDNISPSIANLSNLWFDLATSGTVSLTSLIQAINMWYRTTGVKGISAVLVRRQLHYDVAMENLVTISRS